MILNKLFCTVYIKLVPDYTAELIYIETKKKKLQIIPHLLKIYAHAGELLIYCLTQEYSSAKTSKPSWLCGEKANHSDYLNPLIHETCELTHYSQYLVRKVYINF